LAHAKSRRPYLKSTLSKKGWKCGLSGRVFAQQVQSPEFKILGPQKKKKKQLIIVKTG
jgi:hypothetical protein